MPLRNNRDAAESSSGTPDTSPEQPAARSSAGVSKAKSPIEMEFYDYARQYGHDWLFKPEWNARMPTSKSMRRTLI